MRVFVAGATGAIGRPLVSRLISAGHEVTGTTRSEARAGALRAAGAAAVVLDALDAPALRAAVLAARPDVVVNQLTDLSAPLNPRRYGRWLAGTQRLRREATATLLDAARDAGAQRLVVQSVSFVTAAAGPPVLDEDAPLLSGAPEITEAVAAMEASVTSAAGIEGLVLRYGYFYGPGTAFAPGGQSAEMVAKRRLPIVGSGEGWWSFVHVEDAADATVLALAPGGPTGILNVVDDEPAPMRAWLPALAQALGAPPPRTVPAWLARLAAGPFAVHGGTTMRGASNARARELLGWRPAHASWREGFAEAGAQRPIA